MILFPLPVILLLIYGSLDYHYDKPEPKASKECPAVLDQDDFQEESN